MDPHLKIIPLHLHPLGFIEGFIAHGASLDALLQDTGVTVAMLERRDIRISYAQQKTLVSNGVRLCRKPGIGVAIGSSFDWSYHGSVGGIVRCAPSLYEAGEALRRYHMIAQPYYASFPRQPSAYIDANGLLVEPFRPLPDRDHANPQLRLFEMEFRLAIVLRLWDECGNKSIPDPSVHVGLDYPEPHHAALYRTLPLSTLRFGCSQSYVAAHKSFILEPFRPLRRPSFDMLIEQCERELRRSKLEHSFSARVRWHLMSHYYETATLQSVAATLGLTDRTLTRRLAAEGTSFRVIQRDVRLALTAHYLRKSRLSVDEIASLTGFSSASSLRRALRSWSGSACSQMREIHSAPHELPASATTERAQPHASQPTRTSR